MAPARVVLAGAHGHGGWHLAHLRRLREVGTAELVGVCDVRPLEGDGAGAVAQSPSLDALLDDVRPDVVIIATPIHTHVDLTEVAARHGCAVLLEKPPAASLADYDRLVGIVAEHGIACQVGFQGLGSDAVPAVRELIASGAIGTVTGIGAAGAWQRDEGYFARAAWAGHRSIDGIPVVDGAITNAFAHALAAALAIDGSSHGPVGDIELELFHANAIESDDTSSLRLRTAHGTPVTVAVTLCAEQQREPYLVVHGDRGRVVLGYTTDEVTVELADGRTTDRFGRQGLLENLVEHGRDPQRRLLVPLDSVRAFMVVLDAVRRGPAPRPVPDAAIEVVDAPAGPRRVVVGIDAVVAASADKLQTFRELGVPWAAPGPDDEVALRAEGGYARYVVAPRLPDDVSPRPYLHPVRTAAGVTVTDAGPIDHVWHLGFGVALPRVGDSNLWGGRTYVRDSGYQSLGDHGHVRHDRWVDRADTRIEEDLTWVGRHGETLLRERRRIEAAEIGSRPGCWALRLTTRLTNATEAPLPLGSPGSNGREGGGYGGIFWRFPTGTQPTTVWTEAGAGEDGVHGRTASWLAVASQDLAGREWSVLLVPGDDATAADPWFVRVAGYPGAGSAIAWDQDLVLPAAGSVSRSLVAVVADGTLSPTECAALHREAATSWQGAAT